MPEAVQEACPLPGEIFAAVQTKRHELMTALIARVESGQDFLTKAQQGALLRLIQTGIKEAEADRKKFEKIEKQLKDTLAIASGVPRMLDGIRDTIRGIEELDDGS